MSKVRMLAAFATADLKPQCQLQRAGQSLKTRFHGGILLRWGRIVLEPTFPFEFVVSGTPRSLQSSPGSRDSWKETVRAASRALLPEGHWLTRSEMAVTLFYFPAGVMEGDIDNILKPILDALSGHIYFDDRQVERIVVQKFEPERGFEFGNPSEQLTGALLGEKPKLYIRLSTDTFEELR